MAEDPFSSKDFDALLDEFIAKQLSDVDDVVENIALHEDGEGKADANDGDDNEERSENSSDDGQIFDAENVGGQEEFSVLSVDEKRLYDAYNGFIEAIDNICEANGEETKDFVFSEEELIPHFKPHKCDNLMDDIAVCWDVLLKYYSEELKGLSLKATDEQILDYAEKLSEPNLQLALISYVETLIEIEACETEYNIRKVKYKKHKIEKELYEEQQKIIAKKRLFAKAIKENNFPVDADLLVTNYFKNAAKDPENAEKILEHNPAVFAPIQVEKIPSRFFGLIKAKPADGARVNRKLGKFLVNLKV